MILQMPSYCEKFKCIADKCDDNCCIGWEIDIDPQTADFYGKVQGEFGQKLKDNISHGEVCSFILKGERCPFLNDNNLCEIIINLGEEHLCQICTDHPRYYEWFDGVKEGGIGLCCEEAARMILSQTSPLSFTEKEIPREDCDEYDEELYECLTKARSKIIAMSEDKTLPLKIGLSAILNFSKKMQDNIDNFDYTLPETDTLSADALNIDISEILRAFLLLEPIDENWMPYIEKAISSAKEVEALDFVPNDTYLRNIAVYFIWRYFLKGVFDGDIISKVKLAIISVAVIDYLYKFKKYETGELTFEDCAVIVKNYSKEIEYSQENIDMLAEFQFEGL